MQEHEASHPQTCCKDTHIHTRIQMHTRTCKQMQTCNTLFTHTLRHTHTLPPPHHLCAVCLKWQCLSVILRQIGREHRSIKGSHGGAEG